MLQAARGGGLYTHELPNAASVSITKQEEAPLKQHRIATLALAALILSACATTPGPKPRSAESQRLYDEIAGLDRAMFDAFNAHDAEKVGTYFADDLEFYHDAGGLASREQSLAGMKGTFVRNNGLRRDLVPGTLQVYPIKDYGAIELGAHRFCHQEDGKDDCGVFQFLHVWQKEDGQWKITRVVSYDH